MKLLLLIRRMSDAVSATMGCENPAPRSLAAAFEPFSYGVLMSSDSIALEVATSKCGPQRVEVRFVPAEVAHQQSLGERVGYVDPLTFAVCCVVIGFFVCSLRR